MTLEIHEQELLDLFEMNKIEETYAFLENHVNLFTSNNEKTITTIMTILIIYSAFEECIEFGKSKKELCKSPDYFYNMGIASVENSMNDFACINFIYAYVFTTEEELKIECSNYILKLIDQLITMNFMFLAIFFNEMNTETLNYLCNHSKNKVLVIDGNLIFDKDNAYRGDEFITKVFDSFDYILNDSEMSILYDIKPIKEKISRVHTFGNSTIALSELLNYFDFTKGINKKYGILEHIVFDYSFERLKDLYNINHEDYESFVEVIKMILNSNFDDVVLLVCEYAKKGNLKSILIYPLIYLYKVKNEYSY